MLDTLVSDFSFSKDFCAYWSSVHLYSQDANFYDPKILNEYQSLHCGVRTGPVFYPPWLLIFFAPFLLFSFSQALVLWSILQVGLLLFLIHLLRKALPLTPWSLILLLSFLPLLYGIKFGQLSLSLTCLLYAAIIVLRDGRYVFAGVLFALTTLKPHLSWLLLVSLLFQTEIDRVRFWGSYLVTLMLLVVPFLIIDPELSVLWQRSLEGAADWKSPTLYGILFPFFSYPLILKLGLLLSGIIIVWYMAKQKLSTLSPELFFLQCVLLCLGSVFLSPYGWIFDYTVACALPIFLSIRTDRWLMVLYIVATVIAYLQSSVLIDMAAYQIAWYPLILFFLGWMIVRDNQHSCSHLKI